MQSAMELQSLQQMRCPTCGAEQVWSDECRRCKSDLTLVRSMAQYAQHTRRNCLSRLRAGRYWEALTLAQSLAALDPASESQQLLAVCHLYCGDLSTAVTIACRYVPTT